MRKRETSTVRAVDAGAFDDAAIMELCPPAYVGAEAYRGEGDCMNNKTQQRFDKSIREAVMAEDNRRERMSRYAKQSAVSKAKELLPATERLLMAGCNHDKKLTKEQMDNLQSARSDYRRILGLTMDREMVDMPTKLKEATE